MARVVYGVWNGVVHDNRGKHPIDIPEVKDLNGVDFFNEGNPIQAFFGDRGFLVFDANVNLVDALWRHMSRSTSESCGKCTPCRMGTKLIEDRLSDVRLGRNLGKNLDDVYSLACQMQETSLCGLGQTCAVALIGAIEHFRDQLEKDAKDVKAFTQYGTSYLTAPCIEACPSKLNVPRYISYIRDGKPLHSLAVILQRYPMAATCGRVCVRFCEMACRRNLVDEAVGIKTLKRYVADHQDSPLSQMITHNMAAAPKPDGMRIAVVGAGPAGVSCAYHLLLRGYSVDVIESAKEAGGMAAIGIPNYRLPKEVLKSETSIIETLGGRFLFNKSLGRDYAIDDLFKQGYRSVFLAVGCNQSTPMGVEGEDKKIDGYVSGIDFLLQVHDHVDGSKPMRLQGDVVVVGGGNVAMDCVRSAVRLGADRVHLVYRRTKEDMPADKEEIEAAEKEGVHFHFLTAPSKILEKNGKLDGFEVVNVRQTEPDASGRRGVEVVRGSEHLFPCTLLISAIGQQVEKGILKQEDGIKFNRWNCIDAHPLTQATSRTGVFAGGDCVTGAKTLIHAMAAGLRAANSIDDYLTCGSVRFSAVARMRQILSENHMLAGDCLQVPVRSMFRVHHPELDPETRRSMFGEVEQTISVQQAYAEAKRCMRCYRVYSVITASPLPEIQQTAAF